VERVDKTSRISQMNDQDKKALKLGLLVNAIFSLLIIFFQRIASFIWNAVIAVGGRVHQGYVDRIYRNAALSDRNMPGSITLLLLLMIFEGLSFYALADILKWTESALEKRPSFTSETALFRKKLVNFLDNIWRGATVGLVMTMLPFCLLLILVASMSLGIMEIDASFNQRLTVLAPAISDVEYKTLKARWATMRSKADYDALVSAMDARARELGVNLPPVRKP
jgi:hypothetical protein